MSDYKDLEKPKMPKYHVTQESLTLFINDELMPEMDKIVKELRSEHKVDIWDLGRRANALKLRISDNLAAAHRMLVEQNSNVTSQLYNARKASAGIDGDAPDIVVVRAQVKERSAALAEICERLEFYRDDLRAVVMFAQSGMKNLREDEMGTNIS